jgi:hypothetical protein
VHGSGGGDSGSSSARSSLPQPGGGGGTEPRRPASARSAGAERLREEHALTAARHRLATNDEPDWQVQRVPASQPTSQPASRADASDHHHHHHHHP